MIVYLKLKIVISYFSWCIYFDWQLNAWWSYLLAQKMGKGREASLQSLYRVIGCQLVI